MKSFRCDICGDYYDDQQHEVFKIVDVSVEVAAGKEPDPKKENIAFDLCPKCFLGFDRFLAGKDLCLDCEYGESKESALLRSTVPAQCSRCSRNYPLAFIKRKAGEAKR